MFGGLISSNTVDLYLERIGDFNENFVHVNWNDHANSLVYVYSLSLGNNFVILMDMTLVNLGKDRSYEAIYFLIVFLVTKM